MSRAALIRERLAARFAPRAIEVIDDSAAHAGHAGATGGESHFRVRIVAEAFGGQPRVARHRLVYAALADLMSGPGAIHALAVDARSPDEVERAADAS